MRKQLIQGETITLTIDLQTLGAFTQVYLEVYKETAKEAKYKFAYPAATGYTTLTKAGDEYTLVITSAQSATMLGNYGVEIESLVSGVTRKAQLEVIDSTTDFEGLTIIKEAK